MPLLMPPAHLQQALEPLGVLLARAREHRDAGRFPEAIQAYDAMLAQAPEHETAQLERAQTLSWMGKYAEAEAGYKRFRDMHPQRAFAADLRLAQLAAWQSRTDQAVAILEAWAAQEQPEAVRDAATYQAWGGQLRQALARLDAWLRIRPDDAEALLLKARFLGWADRKADAEDVYRDVLKAHPEDRDARLGLARLALWSDDPERARRELSALPTVAQSHPDARLLGAQVAAAEGRLRQARAIADDLAKEGRLPQDVRDLRMSLADRQGPAAELSGTRTDTSDHLRVDEWRLRGVVPFFDGSLEGWGVKREVTLPGTAAKPSEVGLGLAQPLAGRVWFNGAAARVQDLGPEGATAWRLGLGWTPLPGLEVSLSRALEWATYTPAATKAHLSLRSTGLEAGWRPGAGLHHLSGGYTYTDLSAGSTRRAWSLGYDVRRPFPGWEVRGGAVIRGFGYSETLPLGFFNPTSYRYNGISAGASLKGGTRYELAADLRLGHQSVNHGDAQTTWGPSLSASFQPAGWTTAFFAAWAKTYAGLPVTATGDPAEYRETTIRFGLKARLLRTLW